MGDYVDFDMEGNCNDDDKASKSSSVYAIYETQMCGIDPENEPADWENLDETNVDRMVGDSLKHVGNVKKRNISKLLLTDVLVPEGVKACKDVKTNRAKILASEKLKIE